MLFEKIVERKEDYQMMFVEDDDTRQLLSESFVDGTKTVALATLFYSLLLSPKKSDKFRAGLITAAWISSKISKDDIRQIKEFIKNKNKKEVVLNKDQQNF